MDVIDASLAVPAIGEGEAQLRLPRKPDPRRHEEPRSPAAVVEDFDVTSARSRTVLPSRSMRAT